MPDQITTEELTAFLEDDDVPAALEERADELEEDPATDLEAHTRQDEGWMGIYAECPDCHAPMATVTTESRDGTVDVLADERDLAADEDEEIDPDDPGLFRQSRTHILGICPACRAQKTAVQLVRLTGAPGPAFPWPEDEAFTWGER